MLFKAVGLVLQTGQCRAGFAMVARQASHATQCPQGKMTEVIGAERHILQSLSSLHAATVAAHLLFSCS